MTISRAAAPVIRGGRLLPDDISLRFGNDADAVAVLSSAGLAANTALTGVLVGTPVTPIAPAANSLLVGNITASGDILLAVNKGGTSYMAFMADASTGDTLVGVPTGASFDVYVAGTKLIDISSAVLAFQQSSSITTTVGTLSLTPVGALLLAAQSTQGLVSLGNANQTVTIGGGFVLSAWLGGGVHTINDAGGSNPANLVGINFGAPQFSSTNTNTVTTAASVYFAGVPSVAGSLTLSTALTIWVDAGACRFDDTLMVGLTTHTNVSATGAGLFAGGIAFTDVANAWIDDATHGDGTVTHYIGNQTITTASDMRLKRDITPTAINATELFRRLNVVDFFWDEKQAQAPGHYNDRGRFTGLLAQETVDIAPWIINAPDRTCPQCRMGKECREHKSFWHVEYQHLVPALVKGFQEHDDRITRLERQLVAAGIVPEEGT